MRSIVKNWLRLCGCSGFCVLTPVLFNLILPGLYIHYVAGPAAVEKAQAWDPSNDFSVLDGGCEITSVQHSTAERERWYLLGKKDVTEHNIDTWATDRRRVRVRSCWDIYKIYFKTNDLDFHDTYYLSHEDGEAPDWTERNRFDCNHEDANCTNSPAFQHPCTADFICYPRWAGGCNYQPHPSKRCDYWDEGKGTHVACPY